MERTCTPIFKILHTIRKKHAEAAVAIRFHLFGISQGVLSEMPRRQSAVHPRLWQRNQDDEIRMNLAAEREERKKREMEDKKKEKGKVNNSEILKCFLHECFSFNCLPNCVFHELGLFIRFVVLRHVLIYCLYFYFCFVFLILFFFFSLTLPYFYSTRFQLLVALRFCVFFS